MAEGGTLPGETAFKLYDTFGFPYDLTEDALRARGLTVDRAGFDAAMAEQKAAARAAWKGSGEKASDELWYDLAEELGATEFTGYSGHEGEGVVLAMVKDGDRVDDAKRGRNGHRPAQPDALLRGKRRAGRRCRKTDVSQWLRRRS